MTEKRKILALIIIAECLYDDEEVKIKRKRIWMKEWLRDKKKNSNEKLIMEIKTNEPNDFLNFTRMNAEAFQELLNKVTPLIKKEDTFMRDSISPETRLLITLRYVAKGNDFEDLKFFYAVSPQAIGKIVIETCEAIISVLNEYIKVPKSVVEWKTEAEKFLNVSGFPHCIGAIDGKHVGIKKPPNSGSYYFNYKKTFSIVLMAVVNANSEFLMVDVGKNGRISDGGVFSYTKFAEMLETDSLNIPIAEELMAGGEKLPYVFVADDAFPLKEYIMKPYSGMQISPQELNFNRCLSSARVRVENAFGILAHRFEILLKPVNLCPEKATKIVLACCYLHNFLKKKNGRIYETITPTENHEPIGLEPSSSRNSTNTAKMIRNKFSAYINTTLH